MTHLKIKVIAMFTITVFAMTMLHLTFAKSVDLKTEKPAPSTGTVTKVKHDLDLCWKHEKFVTKTECMQCQSDEKSKLPACKETGNKQQVECQKSKVKTYISCPFDDSVEKKRFWVFEAASFACAILSNAVVWWRRRSLQYVHYQRVKRQMSDSCV